MENERKIRISIVEDDTDTRRILADVMRNAAGVELVSDHGDGELACKLLPGEKPEVVLMDINLAGSSGVACVERLKPQLPETQFLMLTVYEDADHIFAALKAGATGYLLKNTTQEELLAAIRLIMDGGSPMSSGIARKVVQSFSRPTTPAPAARPKIEGLSPREQAVLDLLAKGFLYKEIADTLAISGPTVNTYVRRIYEKLQVHSRSQAVAKVLES